MIQVEKTATAPAELATKGYKDDKVAEQILADQHDKCYLCERLVGTDYEIEHLHSQANCPLESDEWHNLLVACGYCNKRKGDRYDDIHHPVDVDIEAVIEQRLDVLKGEAQFVAVDGSDSTKRTIELLEILHNDIKHKGAERLRTRRFMNEICEKYADFVRHVDEYISNPSDATLAALRDDLKPESELLGFKRQFLEDNGIEIYFSL